MAYQCLPLNHADVFEPDKEKRECSVMLNTIPLDAPLLKDSPNIATHHWAIVFFFQRGNKLMLFEAGEGQDGKIEVGLANGVWKDDPKIQRYKLGMVNTSPNEVLEQARRNQLNNKPYLATMRNCQNWVKEFAKMISSVLETAIEKFPTYMESVGGLNAAQAQLVVWGIKSSLFLMSNSYQGACAFARDSFQSSQTSSKDNFSSSARFLSS